LKKFNWKFLIITLIVLTTSAGALPAGNAAIPFTVASAIATPASRYVPTGYTSGTITYVYLTRSGNAGSNPTTTLSVTGGTWTVSAFSGVQVNKTSVTSSSPVVITLLGSTGSYKLALNTGSPVGTYLARDTSTSSLSYPVSVGNPPSAVRLLTCSKGNNFGTVNCSWQMPYSIGSSGITEYAYRSEYSSSSNLGWGDWVSNNLSMSILLTGLRNRTSYDFQVFAVNAYGPGPAAQVTFTA